MTETIGIIPAAGFLRLSGVGMGYAWGRAWAEKDCVRRLEALVSEQEEES